LPDRQITRAAELERVQPLLKKYSDFPKTQITSIFTAIQSHSRGALRNVINAGRDAVDADGTPDEGA
jgi:hypothetical protein